MATETITQGTNSKEMEVLEFILAEQSFGVSVLKIEAIEQYEPSKVTVIPTLPMGVIGTLLFRNKTVPLVDLTVELGVESKGFGIPMDEDEEADGETTRIVLVINFNNATVAFIADGVDRIHRVLLSDINPMDSVFDQGDSKFTGSFHIEGREILIADMEKLVSQVVPAAGACGIGEVDDIEHPNSHLRSDIKIVLVEDSSTTRTVIKDILAKGGYTNMTTFRDGKSAYEAITDLKSKADQSETDISELLNLVITDIEMPQMDGLTLAGHVKQTLGLPVPVILYSTLINEEEEMISSETGVCADMFIPKPQIAKLVAAVDKLALDE